jgi:hypothetical protein
VKVYVVLEQNQYTDYEFCGVYTSEEKAQERINEIIKDNPGAEEGLYIEEIDI